MMSESQSGQTREAIRGDTCGCGGQLMQISRPCPEGRYGRKRSVSVRCVDCETPGAIITTRDGAIIGRVGPLFERITVVVGP